MKPPNFLKNESAAERKAFKSLAALYEAGFTDLATRHEAGKLTQELVPPVHRSETYGDNRMVEVATALLAAVPRENATVEQVRTILYQCRDFAESYTSAELKRLGDLSWTQVRSLMAVSDKSVRRSLEEKCQSKGWTSRELNKAVQETRQKKDPQRFARRDSKNALEGMVEAAARYREDLAGRLETLTKTLEHLEVEVVTAEVVPLLHEAVKALADLEGDAGQAGKRLKAMTPGK